MSSTLLAGLATARRLRSDPLGTFMDGWREQGDVVRFPLGGPFAAYLVVHPTGVDRVLRTASARYGKVPWHNARFRELLGTGIATSEGERWRSRRRLAQPAFHRERIAEMVDVMAATALEVANRWERHRRNGEVIGVSSEMMQLTLTIAGRTLLGVDPARLASALGSPIDVALRHIVRRMESFVAVPLAVPTPHNRRFVRARRELDRFILSVIAERRAGPRRAVTFLDLLLDARHEATGRLLNDGEIRDEVMTMLMAGHESTAVGLSWTWYLLARSPEWADSMRAEAGRVLGDRMPTAEDLPALAVTGQIFDEALRLYPPAWATTRTPTEPDEIGGHVIRPGQYVIVSPYVTHRHPAFWSRPERFDPGRFDRGVPRGEARFSYFPFGGGPRQCLGLSFALAEAKVILAVLGRQFSPGYAGRGSPIPAPHVTLRPADGMPMHLA